MSTETRDGRRWSTYERLAADPTASASERTQAREQLDTLRQRYPAGPPGRRERGVNDAWWRAAGPRTYSRQEAPRPEARWASPEELAAEAERVRQAREVQAEAARVHRERAVEHQRASVERVPRWEASGILQELHASRSEWSQEEHRRFKDQRARLTGSSRAVDF